MLRIEQELQELNGKNANILSIDPEQRIKNLQRVLPTVKKIMSVLTDISVKDAILIHNCLSKELEYERQLQVSKAENKKLSYSLS